MSVTYNGYMSISSIANQLEVMDRDQFLANGGNDRGYDTNWMDEITRTPFSHSHNLALTGGTTDFNYRASVSYRNNQGIALDVEDYKYLDFDVVRKDINSSFIVMLDSA
jgi:hypothetical protein